MKPRFHATGAAQARERRDGGEVKLSTFIPTKIRKRGGRTLVMQPSAAEITTRAMVHDQPLLVALVRAFYWQQLLDDGVVASGSDIACREGLSLFSVCLSGAIRALLIGGVSASGVSAS